MRVLVIDTALTTGLVLSQRLVSDGCEVVYHGNWGPAADSPYVESAGRGLPNFKLDTEGWVDHVKWADLAVVVGSERQGNTTAYLRGHGVPVCGLGRWAVNLESNRAYGHQVFREAGLNPTKSFKFQTAKEAYDHVVANPGRYALKLDRTSIYGDTTIGQQPDGRDTAALLQFLELRLSVAECPTAVYLDEYVDGVQVSISGWFTGRKLAGTPIMHLGFGSVSVFDPTTAVDSLVPVATLEETLAKYKYKGPFTLKGFLTPDNEFRPLEWGSRWANGFTEYFCTSTKDMSSLLNSCATGKETEPYENTVSTLIGVVTDMVHTSEDATQPQSVDIPTVPFHFSDGAVWVSWPAKTKTGWMNLPASSYWSRKSGAVVGFGTDFNKAALVIEDTLARHSFSDCSPTGSVQNWRKLGSDLQSAHDKARGFVSGTGWIHKLARETGSVFNY